MYCRNCGNQIDPLADMCVTCGYANGKGENFCAHCGNQTTIGQDVCTGCGHKIVKETIDKSEREKSRVAAGLLALFLGGLGVHNFYLGFFGRGIAQLLLCWTGISSVWALVDMIIIFASKNKKDAKGRLLA